MSMVYRSGRQGGKTTKLIKESAKTGAIIVVATNSMVRYVDFLARELDLKIPKPITTDRYIRILARDGFDIPQKYLIDELQMVLDQMNVKMATIDDRCVDTLQCGLRPNILITDEEASK